MVTYYKKVGNRYKPVLEKDVWAGETWNEGCHLVICKPGTKTIRYNIEPDDSAFLAASILNSDFLAKMLLEASRGEMKAPITEEQKKAWDEMGRVFDGGPFLITFPSAQEIARKFFEKIKNHFEGR